MDITSTLKIQNLTRGATKLRRHPEQISHEELAALVADWIEAEVLMWDTAQQMVDLTNSVVAEISGGRAGRVEFGFDSDGNPKINIDTSVHAERIIAALVLPDEEPDDA